MGRDLSGTMVSNNARCIYANIRSVIPKRDDLCSLIASSEASIVLLTETWLHGDISDSEIFPDHPDFCIFRRDRTSRRGGGVLIAVKQGITCSRLQTNSEIEVVWVQLHCSYENFIIGVLSPIRCFSKFYLLFS